MQIECIHDAVARTRYIIVFGPVLNGIRHVQNTAEICYVERRISRGQIRVREVPGQGRSCRVPFQYVDRSVAKVRGVCVDVGADVRIGQAFIDVGGAAQLQSFRRGSQCVSPSPHCAVFVGEQECVAVKGPCDIAERDTSYALIACHGYDQPLLDAGAIIKHR